MKEESSTAWWPLTRSGRQILLHWDTWRAGHSHPIACGQESDMFLTNCSAFVMCFSARPDALQLQCPSHSFCCHFCFCVRDWLFCCRWFPLLETCWCHCCTVSRLLLAYLLRIHCILAPHWDNMYPCVRVLDRTLFRCSVLLVFRKPHA
jgi:hypothetical protein